MLIFSPSSREPNVEAWDVPCEVIFVVIFYEAAMFNGILCEAGDASAGRAGSEKAFRVCETMRNSWAGQKLGVVLENPILLSRTANSLY